MEAYIAGLEADDRRPVRRSSSVASFFVSRVDTEADRRLDAIGTPRPLALRGKVAVANAQVAYEAVPRDLLRPPLGGARRPGRPGAAPAVGVDVDQEPGVPDTLYVDTLIGPDTVNTMPERPSTTSTTTARWPAPSTPTSPAAHAVLDAPRRRRRRPRRRHRHPRGRGRGLVLEVLRRAPRVALGQGRRPGMNGDLVVVDDVAEAFATTVVEAYRGRPNDGFAIALSGGGTARRCYERLAADAGDAIDWWKVDVYWGDERCVPLDDPDSNYRLAREALLDRVGAANATYPMRCDEGADAYQLRLGELGRFDLVHLGPRPRRPHRVAVPRSAALDADPGRLVVINDDPLGHNPHPRMTLTFEGIARARLVVVTVEGEAKAEALARVRAGDPTAPASLVDAERVVWLVDHAALGD